MHSPNGLGTIEPVVVFMDPYLYKFEAVIVYSRAAFGPKSLSVALIIVINSFREALELTPAKYSFNVNKIEVNYLLRFIYFLNKNYLFLENWRVVI